MIACFLLTIMLVMRVGFSIFDLSEIPALEMTLEPREVTTIIGQVYDREIRSENHALYLKNLYLSDKNTFPDGKIIVYVNKENENLKTLEIGNYVKVSGRIIFFDEARNPGNFNQRTHYHKQGIHGSFFTDNLTKLELESDSSSQKSLSRTLQNQIHKLQNCLNLLKYDWKELLIVNLGENHGGLLSSILLGDKSALEQETKKLFQKNGIGHILVISGLHMSFLGVGLYNILRRTGLSFAIAGGIACVFLIFYTQMIGIGVSSFRALLMFGIKMGAEVLGRRYDGGNSLAIASIAFLFWRPHYLLDPSFLLSFSAVLSIVLFVPVLEKLFLAKKEKRFRKYIKRGFIFNIAINLTLTPIILYFFFEIPLYTLLINVLVVPLVAFLLGLGILGSLLFLVIPVLGQAVFMVCRMIFIFYEILCDFFINLPFSRIITGQPKIWQIVLYYLLLALLYVLLRLILKVCEKARKEKNKTGGNATVVYKFGQNGRVVNRKELSKLKRNWEIVEVWKEIRLKMLFLTLVFAAMLLSLYPIRSLDKSLWITMIDVGQGDGVFIRDSLGSTYLVDGGSSNVSSVGRFRIEPFLLFSGIRELDYVFISHGDADHYNGVLEMLENQRLGVKINTLVIPSLEFEDEDLKLIIQVALENQTPVATIEEKQKIENGDFEILCIGPVEGIISRGKNDHSMILSVSYQNFNMIFTGDVEEAGERALVRSENLTEHTVLKVAHHGSKTSSTPPFLEQVKPKVALISAGQNNRFNHPSPEVVESIETFGAEIFVTKDVGAITIKTDGRKVEIETYLTFP